eukprot:gene7688-851_t
MKGYENGFPVLFENRMIEEQAANVMQYLMDGNYLDGKTKGLTAEILSYNQELHVLGYARGNFKWMLDGSIKVFWEFLGLPALDCDEWGAGRQAPLQANFKSRLQERMALASDDDTPLGLIVLPIQHFVVALMSIFSFFFMQHAFIVFLLAHLLNVFTGLKKDHANGIAIGSSGSVLSDLKLTVFPSIWIHLQRLFRKPALANTGASGRTVFHQPDDSMGQTKGRKLSQEHFMRCAGLVDMILPGVESHKELCSKLRRDTSRTHRPTQTSDKYHDTTRRDQTTTITSQRTPDQRPQPRQSNPDHDTQDRDQTTTTPYSDQTTNHTEQRPRPRQNQTATIPLPHQT